MSRLSDHLDMTLIVLIRQSHQNPDQTGTSCLASMVLLWNTAIMLCSGYDNYGLTEKIKKKRNYKALCFIFSPL